MRRTTATTDYLKESMGTALLELMQDKPIEKISIEEMTAKADVGRSTYFRYFHSKDEVLSFKILCLWRRFCAQRGSDGISRVNPEGIKALFEFCLSIRPIFDCFTPRGIRTLSSISICRAPPPLSRRRTQKHIILPSSSPSGSSGS